MPRTHATTPRRTTARATARVASRPSAAFRRMERQWTALCADPTFRDLPYKIETTSSNAIIFSPASNRHSLAQGRIERLLNRMLPSGTAMPECSIATDEGVKVADVAWMSKAFLDRHGDESLYRVAPEICIEVVSPTNKTAELRAKIALYLAKGASEVWIVSERGSIAIFSHDGELTHSRLCPRFPDRI